MRFLRKEVEPSVIRRLQPGFDNIEVMSLFSEGLFQPGPDNIIRPIPVEQFRAPAELRIMATGTNRSPLKGDYLFTDRSAAMVQAYATEWGNLFSSDYEHAAFHPDRKAAPASSWYRLQVRPDGLYAHAMGWQEEAAEFLRTAKYRYISPAFLRDPEKGEVIIYLNFSLTNLPATADMAPILTSVLAELSATIPAPVQVPAQFRVEPPKYKKGNCMRVKASSGWRRGKVEDIKPGAVYVVKMAEGGVEEFAEGDVSSCCACAPTCTSPKSCSCCSERSCCSCCASCAAGASSTTRKNHMLKLLMALLNVTEGANDQANEAAVTAAVKNLLESRSLVTAQFNLAPGAPLAELSAAISRLKDIAGAVAAQFNLPTHASVEQVQGALAAQRSAAAQLSAVADRLNPKLLSITGSNKPEEMEAGLGRVSTLMSHVATLTGKNEVGEQVATLTAFKQAAGELTTLNARVKELEGQVSQANQEKAQATAVATIDKHIAQGDITPASRENALRIYSQFGQTGLDTFIANMPKPVAGQQPALPPDNGKPPATTPVMVTQSMLAQGQRLGLKKEAIELAAQQHAADKAKQAELRTVPGGKA